MEILDAATTEARLPYAELADSIREMALARKSGGVQAPPRQAVPLSGGGTLLIMPATDEDIVITKLVTIHPENAKRDLPTIQGEVIVVEAATGTRLGILDGAAATARRTAALSLLAAMTLAPHPGGPLLIVGAGAQARSHLEAFADGLGVTRVFLTSRTAERANSLAEHARSLGVDARVVDDPEDALDEVSLVFTATTSREPVLPEKLPEGTFVAAVGTFDPETAELPAGLALRAALPDR